jgi:hydrogenase nickel incorporation protein HypA/HybF
MGGESGCQAPPVSAVRFPRRFRKSEIRNPKSEITGVDLVGSYTNAVHEMGIAIEVYRTCRETIEAHGGGRLQGVRLAVGELSAVEPDLLVSAWEAVVFDSSDASAELEIRWCPALQFCSSCNQAKERSEGSWMRVCPDCGSPLQVSGGDELDVLDLTFEEDGPADVEAFERER